MADYGYLDGSGLMSPTLGTYFNPPWVLLSNIGQRAVFDMDVENNRYWYDGQPYFDKLALLTAARGTDLAGGPSFGPYLDPFKVNHFPNGGLDAGVDNWLMSHVEVAAAKVAGELELTFTGGATRGASVLLGGHGGKAFLFRAEGRRGTTTNTLALIATNVPSLGAGQLSTETISSTSLVAIQTYVSSSGFRYYFGVRNSSSAGSGTAYFDNFSLVEAVPFKGWNTPCANSVYIKGTAASALPAAEQTIWTAYTSSRDYVSIVWGTDGNVYLVVRIDGAEVVRTSAGAVAAGADFGVALSFAFNAFYMSLNGATSISSTTASVPGCAYMRVGNNDALTARYEGTIKRVAIVPSTQPTQWLEQIAAPVSANRIWTDGDSYMDGALGVVLKTKLATSTARTVVNTAVGGSTFNQVRDRILERAYLKGLTVVIWDGSANGYTTVNAWLAIVDQIAAYLGKSRLVIIPPVNVGPSASATPTAYTLAMDAIHAGIVSRGIKTLDAQGILATLSNGSAQDIQDVAAGVVPTSLLLDTVHLNNPAMDLMSTQIATLLSQNGI